jgi:hypothetical protein
MFCHVDLQAVTTEIFHDLLEDLPLAVRECMCFTYDGAPPVTVAEQSEACTVFAPSEAGIVGWNPTQGMDIWCLCTGRGLATS